MGFGRSLRGESRATLLAGLIAVGALALLLTPAGASAAKKKLSVKVASSSQTQVQNQGALKVSFKAKGLSKLKASATAEAGAVAKAKGISGQVDFAGPATKNNPKQGTLSLPLTDDGQAALDDCASLSIKVKASGSGKKANASANLAEDDPECAKPVKEFDLETSAAHPTGIDVGSDGALWFAQMGNGENSLGRMTTDGEYSDKALPVPAGFDPSSGYGHTVNDVASGPDGRMWVTPMGFGGEAFVRAVSPATGEIDEVDTGESNGFGMKIATGPDGAMWVTNGFSSNALVRITTDGDATQFPLVDPAHPEITPTPYGIAAGGDGDVWFTTPDPNSANPPAAIGRFDPVTAETQMFPLDDETELPGYMTTDAAGRLWFTTPAGNSIGRIDPTSGQVLEFKIPTPDSKPIGITFATDGSLWFTEANADNIGRYDPATGLFTEYPLETSGSLPFDIVQAEDGKIYFTETGTGKIGQLDPNKAPAGDPNPSDGLSVPAFAEAGRCPPGGIICQQQVNLRGSTFDIGTALHQDLPPETLKLTAGIAGLGAGSLLPPASGPMLEAKPLDVVVAGTPATTKIGLAGPPVLNALLPLLNVTVPIDLYVSQPGNPAGGCVIGPVVQNLQQVPDDEGDLGGLLAGDSVFSERGTSEPSTRVQPGVFLDDTFSVPEARGCGALTDIINNVLSLPSESGNNETRLPFSILIAFGVGF
jgi:virginiamycin B lyase